MDMFASMETILFIAHPQELEFLTSVSRVFCAIFVKALFNANLVTLLVSMQMKNVTSTAVEPAIKVKNNKKKLMI